MSLLSDALKEAQKRRNLKKEDGEVFLIKKENERRAKKLLIFSLFFLFIVISGIILLVFLFDKGFERKKANPVLVDKTKQDKKVESRGRGEEEFKVEKEKEFIINANSLKTSLEKKSTTVLSEKRALKRGITVNTPIEKRGVESYKNNKKISNRKIKGEAKRRNLKPIKETPKNSMISKLIENRKVEKKYDVESVIKKADKLFFSKSYREAISLYESIVSKGYTLTHVLKNLAISYYRVSDLNSSIKYFKLILVNEPKNRIALYNCGIISLKIKELSDSEYYFGKLIEFYPEEKDAYFYLGAINDSKAQYDKALFYYRKYLSVSPYGSKAQWIKRRIKEIEG